MKKAGRSLLGRVALCCAATLTVFALISAAVSFTIGYEDAQERQDDLLKEVVGMLSRDIVQQRYRDKIQELTTGGFYGPGSSKGEKLPQYGALTMDDDDFEDRFQLDDDSSKAVIAPGEQVIVRLLHKKGRATVTTFDRAYSDGAHTVRFLGDDYRLYIRTLADGTHVAAAQRLRERNKTVLAAALTSAAPILILTPVMLAVLLFVLYRELVPVKRLVAEIDNRRADDLSPLATKAPSKELQRLTASVDGYISRIGELRAREARFVADAAHELRSPMTALSLQADRLASQKLSKSASECVVNLRAGIARTSNLISQLLTLKRAQAAGSALEKGEAQCLKVVSAVVEDIFVIAQDKSITIDVEGFDVKGADAVYAAMPESEFFCIVRNLVHNAVNYTPEGGHVVIAMKAAQTDVTLTVCDNGPGIEESERERVFDPFYRVLGTEQTGTGLGLAICKTIAQKYGARIALDWSDKIGRKGLAVAVVAPRAGRGA